MWKSCVVNITNGPLSIREDDIMSLYKLKELSVILKNKESASVINLRRGKYNFSLSLFFNIIQCNAWAHNPIYNEN